MKSHNWVIMPALDEAENLRWLLPELVSKYSVVVVDNGSQDDSAGVARSLGADVVFCHKKGYGNAVYTGVTFVEEKFASLEQAQYEVGKNSEKKDCASLHGDVVIAVFDADGTSPLDGLAQVIGDVRYRNFDMSIGQRVMRKSGSMPKHSEFGNWLQVTLIAALTGVVYLDMGPLRAIKLEKLKELQMVDRTWGWNVEMQIKAALRSFKINEFAVVYSKRRHGVSKISGSLIGSIRAATRILYTIFYYYLTSVSSLVLSKRGKK